MASYTVNKSENGAFEVYDLEVNGEGIVSTPRFIQSVLPDTPSAGIHQLTIDRDMTYRFVTGFKFTRTDFGTDSLGTAVYICDANSTYDIPTDKTNVQFTVVTAETPDQYEPVDTSVPLGRISYTIPTADVATSLELPGRGTLNYGERQHENTVHILENFATTDTAPNAPIEGQRWFRMQDNTMRIFDGTVFTADRYYGDGTLIFEDAQHPTGGANAEGSRPKVFFGANVTADSDVGATLRIDTNPNTADSIFRIVDATGNEAMRVEYNGYTSSYNSQSISNANPTIRFDETDTANQNWELNHQAGVLRVMRADDGFAVKNAVARFEQDGSVVIGLAAATDLGTLTVQQLGTTNADGFSLVTPNGSKELNMYINGTDNSIINSGTVGNSLLVLNEGTGGVLIGTETPDGKLTVKQNTDNVNSGFTLKNAAENASFSFWINGTERRIDGGDTAGGEVVINGSGTGPVGVGTLDTTRARFTVQQDLMLVDNGTLGSPALKIGNTDDGLIREAAPESITVVVNGVRQVAFQDGVTVNSSDTVISNAAPSMLFDETDTVDQNYRVQLNGGILQFIRENDNATVPNIAARFNQDLSMDLLGDFDVGVGKFTVVAASGNTLVGGTLTSTGNSQFNGTTNDFTGTVTMDQTLDVTGAFDVGTGNFTVGVNGDTFAAGILTVTGAATFNTNVDVDDMLLDGSTISTTTVNTNLTLAPNGTGIVSITKGLDVIGNATFTYVDVDNILIDANTITTTNTNGNLTITPNGTGEVQITKALTVTGAATFNTNVDVDNLLLDGNTIASTDANGNVVVNPNGTGLIQLQALTEVDAVQSGVTTDAAVTTTKDISVSLTNVHSHTLTGDVTYTFSGATSGKRNTLQLITTQDPTTPRTITWPASVKWEGGVAGVATAVVNAIDVFEFFTVDGGTTWFGHSKSNYS
jgi:hypothetical protein